MLSLQTVSSSAEQLSLMDKLTLLSQLVEWIKREIPFFSIGKTPDDMSAIPKPANNFQDDFWNPRSLEEIMIQQGITETQTIRPLEGFDDDVEEMVATIYQWRREDAEREQL
ncbi:MAG: hypothetical protein AAF639_40375 [Chloroflexota bacterium]